jgi:hypothetical protein
VTSTAETVHVDVIINMPLDDGGFLPVRQGIGAIRTGTEGLVVFPAVTGPFEVEESRWDITHVGTGRRIPIAFPDQESATACADEAGALTDWSADHPSVPALAVVRLGQKHGGVPDPHVAHAMARLEARAGGAA